MVITLLSSLSLNFVLAEAFILSINVRQVLLMVLLGPRYPKMRKRLRRALSLTEETEIFTHEICLVC